MAHARRDGGRRKQRRDGSTKEYTRRKNGAGNASQKHRLQAGEERE